MLSYTLKAIRNNNNNTHGYQIQDDEIINQADVWIWKSHSKIYNLLINIFYEL